MFAVLVFFLDVNALTVPGTMTGGFDAVSSQKHSRQPSFDEEPSIEGLEFGVPMG